MANEEEVNKLMEAILTGNAGRLQLRGDTATYVDESAYVDSDDPTVASGSWSIQNLQSCEWALGRAAALETEKAQIEEAAASAHKRIDSRKETLLGKLGRGINFFEAQIAKYATNNRDLLLGGGKRKSKVFLHGIVGWRKKGGKLTVLNHEELGKWLREHGDVNLFRVKIEPEMKALQDAFQATGVIPPGCEYIPESETLYIDPVDPAMPMSVRHD